MATQVRNLKKEFTCLDCGEKFTAPNFTCELTNENHRVEQKIYHVAAPSLIVHWKSEQTLPVAEGRSSMVRIPGRKLQASRGVISSTDAEEQLFLDYYDGCISNEQWAEINIPKDERSAMATRELKRLEAKRNELLAEVEALANAASNAKKAGKAS